MAAAETTISGDLPAWVICPDATVTWPDNGLLTFMIAKLTPAVATGTYYVSETLYGLSPAPQPILTNVLVAAPPNEPRQLWQYLGISMDARPGTSSPFRASIVSANESATETIDRPSRHVSVT